MHVVQHLLFLAFRRTVVGQTIVSQKVYSQWPFVVELGAIVHTDRFRYRTCAHVVLTM